MEWLQTTGSDPISYLPLGKMEIRHESTDYCGIPCEATKYIGRAKYKRCGEILEADEYHQFDNGPKYGVSKIFSYYPKDDTPENHRQRMEELKGHAAQALGVRCLPDFC